MSCVKAPVYEVRATTLLLSIAFLSRKPKNCNCCYGLRTSQSNDPGVTPEAWRSKRAKIK